MTPLWGWDDTPGIVSVWADDRGQATVWRRDRTTRRLVRDRLRFRPWLLLAHLEDLPIELRHQQNGGGPLRLQHRELHGPGALRHHVSADDGRVLAQLLLSRASQRLGRPLRHMRDLGKSEVLVLPPEEQYLVASGRTYFRGLAFDDVHRLQFDLETTGLHPDRDRIFLIAVRLPTGRVEILEAAAEDDDAAEADLIVRLMRLIRQADPDVIENHNLHGFDLPFLNQRARRLGVNLSLGRLDHAAGLRTRPARRGVADERDADRRVRFVAPGRELIDTLDAVLRHDFTTRAFSGHGLKVVARHLGIAAPDREYIAGHEVHDVYRRDPDRVRRYAASDVEEVAGVSRLLGGASFALAQMAPRRYERLADAGAATGVIDPLLVRAYLRAGHALPTHQPGDGTTHSGAALHLFATGVAKRVVKADVASLYPSLMRAYRIGPTRDGLGALLALVDGLVERRLESKAAARAAAPGSSERHQHEAMSSAMKLVVNSAYGYLAAGGGLTRFADVHAANEVTRRGRETLDLMCRALEARGVTLLEADTDGVYFSVPDGWTETHERRVVAEVAGLLPPLVHLEFEGRYAAMLSHEPKNYALLGYDGTLTVRGVAFRSSRIEPFANAFLRRAIACLLRDDIDGVRTAYLETRRGLIDRQFSTQDVSSRIRLTKSSEEYATLRETRRELAYEAILASGRTAWRAGERVRVYRSAAGHGVLAAEVADDDAGTSAGVVPDARDYDAGHYARLLTRVYAGRFLCAFSAEDFAAVFADPEQPSLFELPMAAIKVVLTTRGADLAASSGAAACQTDAGQDGHEQER